MSLESLMTAATCLGFLALGWHLIQARRRPAEPQVPTRTNAQVASSRPSRNGARRPWWEESPKWQQE